MGLYEFTLGRNSSKRLKKTILSKKTLVSSFKNLLGENKKYLEENLFQWYHLSPELSKIQVLSIMEDLLETVYLSINLDLWIEKSKILTQRESMESHVEDIEKEALVLNCHDGPLSKDFKERSFLDLGIVVSDNILNKNISVLTFNDVLDKLSPLPG